MTSSPARLGGAHPCWGKTELRGSPTGRGRDTSPSSCGWACPASTILDRDASLPSALWEHLLSTPNASASPVLASRVFITSLWVLKGPGEDNSTGRNLLLPGRSVYSSPSALGVAACAAGSCLARRLTAPSGPIHCKAADSSHLPRSPAERSEISGAETLPSDGAQWLMHSSNCQRSSPTSETSFHKGVLG